MGRLTRASAFAVAAAVLIARPGAASSFTVNPTQVVLSAKSTSALLTLKNDSSQTLRFQLTVFSWGQTPQGAMKLEKTDDIVFFPSLLSLAPNEERRVRVGATTPFAATEKTYRIFVEELPPQNPDSQASIRMLTKMGIPIFIQPAKVRAEGALRDLALKDGVLAFSVYNTGNVHFMPQTVTVRGRNSTGGILFENHVEGWYILASGERDFSLTLPTPACRNVTALSVVVQVGSSSLEERLDTPPAACTP